MKNILERFKSKTPHYPNMYRESILDRFSRKGGGSEEEKVGQGKYFANYYECYIYAAMLGVRKNHRLPFDRNKDGTSFILIDAWKPQAISEYLFLCLLTKIDTTLSELEDLDDEQTNEKANDLLHLLEEYANGGFDLIKARLVEQPHFFQDAFGAVLFLKEG